MKSITIALLSGVGLVVAALLVAFTYVWLYPEGGDSWDPKYFFTHPAFFILFTAGAGAGVAWERFRSAKRR